MGNYSLGLEDQQAFPELNLDEVKRAQGMNITLVTSAKRRGLRSSSWAVGISF